MTYHASPYDSIRARIGKALNAEKRRQQHQRPSFLPRRSAWSVNEHNRAVIEEGQRLIPHAVRDACMGPPEQRHKRGFLHRRGKNSGRKPITLPKLNLPEVGE